MRRSLGKSMMVFTLLLAFELQADVINPGTHPVGVCVKIANLNEFPIAVVLAVSGPGGGGNLSGELFKSDSCNGSIYWACTAKLFWASKTFFDSLGIKGILSSNTVRNAFPNILDKKSITASSVHLLCDTIRFYHSTVPDIDSLQSEDRIYTIVQSGDSYGIYLSKLVSHYKNGGSSNVTYPHPGTSVIFPQLRTSPDGTPFAITWEKGCVNITSSKPARVSVKIIDAKGRIVMSLINNFSAGEQFHRPLSCLSPGVYCISLVSTEGRVNRTFGLFAAESWGR